MHGQGTRRLQAVRWPRTGFGGTEPIRRSRTRFKSRLEISASFQRGILVSRAAPGITHNGKTATLAGLGQNDLAVKEFKDSINLQPDNAWVYFNRVQFHERNNDIAAPAAAYRVALDKEKPPLSLLKRVLPKSD
jgi:hypothetical protein